jgi:formyltetrahydrofolate deformylase
MTSDLAFRYVLTLQCPDRPGIVHGVAEALLAADANILENDQFREAISGAFCMRTRFETSLPDVAGVRAHLDAVAEHFGATLTVRPEAARTRTLIMVSKFDHCLSDLLYRWRADELPIDIPLVISNHFDCQELVARHGIPFVHLPITPTTKAAQEQRMLDLVEQHNIELVVLARYMQILSSELCDRMAGRVINIHHSFLPGFKGAKPYHQAFERGVKIIGATAHYVTSDLDEGPIIEQDVFRVSHAYEAEDLAIVGRDVERQVLARAVKLHAEDRLLRIGGRVVVFD